MAFGLTIAAGFAAFALYALGCAVDFRGWGTQQVIRSRNYHDPERVLRRYVRWFDFVVFGAAAFGCVWLVTQIVHGKRSLTLG